MQPHTSQNEGVYIYNHIQVRTRVSIYTTTYKLERGCLYIQPHTSQNEGVYICNHIQVRTRVSIYTTTYKLERGVSIYTTTYKLERGCLYIQPHTSQNEGVYIYNHIQVRTRVSIYTTTYKLERGCLYIQPHTSQNEGVYICNHILCFNIYSFIISIQVDSKSFSSIFRSGLSTLLKVLVPPLFEIDGVKQDLYPSIYMLNSKFSFSLCEGSVKVITLKSVNIRMKNIKLFRLLSCSLNYQLVNICC